MKRIKIQNVKIDEYFIYSDKILSVTAKNDSEVFCKTAESYFGLTGNSQRLSLLKDSEVILITEKEKFVLDYIKKRGHLLSWDWDFDLLYLKKFYPEVYYDVRSYTVIRTELSCYNLEFLYKEKKKIFATLRKFSLIYGEWSGTGIGSSDYLGTNRLRCYRLLQDIN